MPVPSLIECFTCCHRLAPFFVGWRSLRVLLLTVLLPVLPGRAGPVADQEPSPPPPPAPGLTYLHWVSFSPPAPYQFFPGEERPRHRAERLPTLFRVPFAAALQPHEEILPVAVPMPHHPDRQWIFQATAIAEFARQNPAGPDASSWQTNRTLQAAWAGLERSGSDREQQVAQLEQAESQLSTALRSAGRSATESAKLGALLAKVQVMTGMAELEWQLQAARLLACGEICHQLLLADVGGVSWGRFSGGAVPPPRPPADSPMVDLVNRITDLRTFNLRQLERVRAVGDRIARARQTE